jgi:hypothetical protein
MGFYILNYHVTVQAFHFVQIPSTDERSKVGIHFKGIGFTYQLNQLQVITIYGNNVIIAVK